MKKSLIILAIASMCLVCGGCKKDVDYFHYNSNVVDNQSSYSFEIIAEASQADYLALRNMPSNHNVPSNTPSEWIVKNSNNSGINPVISGKNIITFSFCFENGVRHTFQGDIIENDFRSESSWVCNNAGAENYSEGSVYNIYTYTFTDEDYQRIMALYE